MQILSSEYFWVILRSLSIIMMIVGSICFFGFCVLSCDYNYNKNVPKFMVGAFFSLLIAAIGFSLPNLDSVWEARITLLKLEATSNETIAKGLSEVERVFHKIECKYLGCKEEDKK